MFYNSELSFLREMLKRIKVQSVLLSVNDSIKKIADADLEETIKESLFPDISISEYFGKIEEQTIYKMTDPLGLIYIFFILPEIVEDDDTVIFIGPYKNDVFSTQQILENEEKNGLSPKLHKYMEDYYSRIPQIQETSHLFVAIDIFCELIWKNKAFSWVDIDKEPHLPISPINDSSNSDDLDSILINMNMMEKRYQLENELIQAVSLGQINKANLLLNSFSVTHFEKRLSDPLRNLKNYCIIMNTLLRKAAEDGGVHPIYLDSVSSSFAVRIEQTNSLSDGSELAYDMFCAYCRLVRKHSMKDYSPLVQKAIIFIDSNLSANLSLSTIAKVQNISSGYLSSIFKKETGKTITDYIVERRIKHATHLLSTTHLQVQTVALHCGIMDVQYFSKIFKRLTGKTPREYRESLK